MAVSTIKFPLFNKVTVKQCEIYSTNSTGKIVSTQKIGGFSANEIQVTENENVVIINGFITVNNLGTLDTAGTNSANPIAITFDGFIVGTSNVAIQSGVVNRLKGYNCPMQGKDTLQVTCEVPDGRNYMRIYVESPVDGSGLNIRSKDITNKFSLSFSVVYQKQLS